MNKKTNKKINKPEEVGEHEPLWKPRTKLGEEVLNNKITIDEIFKQGRKIKEPEIIDNLFPNLDEDIILIGGTPGKGGGIRRTPTKRTVRMHRSGRRYKIASMSVVGNRNGYVGLGVAYGKDHHTAINKATKEAKLNIIPVRRGCGSWECGCEEPHSIPLQTQGKSGSMSIVLKPAPKGVGLCISSEGEKLLELAGIKDIWSKSFGEKRNRVNMLRAIFDGLKNMNTIKGMGEETITHIELPEKGEKETKKQEESKEKQKQEETEKKSEEKEKQEKTEAKKKTRKEEPEEKEKKGVDNGEEKK